MTITIYTTGRSAIFDRKEDGVAPFEIDLMIDGLSESDDIEQQDHARWGHVVILKGTTATRKAIEAIRRLAWVLDVTVPMSAIRKGE